MAEADAEARVEEAPGFAVFFEEGAGGTASGGIKSDPFAIANGLDGNDVPEIFGDEVGGEKVDFGGSIDLAIGSGGFDAIAVLGISGGGFDLHAKEAAIEFNDGVVAVAVSPREADSEAERCGAGEECGFCGFSAALAGVGDGVDGDGGGRRLDQDRIKLLHEVLTK